MGLPMQEARGKHDYENEAVFRRNTLPHRSYYLPPEATLCLNGSEGEWQFVYSPTASGVPSAERESDPSWERNGGSKPLDWQPITVPAHWQLQGRQRGHGDAWGAPNYTNVQYPFPVSPPHVPSANPTGTYRRKFTVPPAWLALFPGGPRLRLRFDGVDSAYHVWVNGQLIGYAQGSRNAAEFDITEAVTASGSSEVILVVQVYQWSDGSYIEDQDQWWLSGIFRDVHLLGFSATTSIDDWFIRTDLDTEYKDASLQATVTVRTSGPAVLTMRLQDRDNKLTVLGEITVNIKESELAAQAVDVNLLVKDPRKWTAETPNLYHVELTLYPLSSSDRPHTVHQAIGFRKVEILNGLICVNGVSLRLRGTNRHDHHPLHGRAVPHDFMVHDLEQMKRFNLNALRCSHYPPHPRLLQAADEIGLWVMDEADLECHGFYDVIARPLDIAEEIDYEERKKLTFPKAAAFTSDNPAWKAAYLDRVEALVQRDKNHASVIVWSLGNEAFYGQNHKAMYHYIKEVDPSRPVHYEGDAHAETADMFSYMYPPVERLAKLASTEGVDPATGKFDKPVVLCEYGHAMGNGPGGLEDYEELFRQYPRVQGGFIWEWANHGLWKEEKDKNNSYYAYGGDFGDRPNDGTFVMDGLCKSDHQNNPGMPGLVELKTVVQPVQMSLGTGNDNKTLVIKNLYDFVNLSHLTLRYRIEDFSSSASLDGPGTTLLFASDEMELPHIPPHGGEGRVLLHDIDYVGIRGHSDVLLTAIISRKDAAPDFREVAHFQQYLTPEMKNKLLAAPPEHILPPRIPFLTNGTDTVEAKIEDHRFLFNSALGYLIRWTVDTNTSTDPIVILGPNSNTTAPPGILPPAIALGFWRAPTDNDRPLSLPYWKRFGVDDMRLYRVESFQFQLDTGCARIRIKSVIAPPVLGWGWNCTTVYTVGLSDAGNGKATVNVQLSPFGSAPTHVPRIGLDVRASKDLQHFAWYGQGPGESYPDKNLSQQIGIYEAGLDGLQTPYDVPQENGNRMRTGWMTAADSKDGNARAGFRATLADETENSKLVSGFSWAAGPYSAQVLDAAAHPCDLVGKEDTDAVLVRLDARVAGVGSAACGPGVRPDLLAKVENVSFSFTLESFI
ncbi:Beta-galactosidase (Lactase) [Sporothrix curviconia]|uniref:Lactase n=1 Tax=Sporothrix curviconia TaxID=1260050 RepID=A0ABP0CG62_9PEZI